MRNSSNSAAAAWFMSGLSVIEVALLYNGSDPNWIPAGLSDINGDGKIDILWRNAANGYVMAWLMNGSAVIGSDFVFAGTPGWNVAGFSDIPQVVLTMAVSGSGTTSPAAGDKLRERESASKHRRVSGGGMVVRRLDFERPRLSVQRKRRVDNAHALRLRDGHRALHKARAGDFNADGKSDLLWLNTSNYNIRPALMSGRDSPRLSSGL